MLDKVTPIGQVTHFVDTVFRASTCNASMIDKLKIEVELQNPSVIFATVTWNANDEGSTGHDHLVKFMAEQEDVYGRTCIVADTRHTSRWDPQKQELRRGDLALCGKCQYILC